MAFPVIAAAAAPFAAKFVTTVGVCATVIVAVEAAAATRRVVKDVRKARAKMREAKMKAFFARKEKEKTFYDYWGVRPSLYCESHSWFKRNRRYATV